MIFGSSSYCVETANKYYILYRHYKHLTLPLAIYAHTNKQTKTQINDRDYL